MPPKSHRWGTVLFICAFPLMAIALYMIKVFPAGGYRYLYHTFIPYTGLILSIAVFTAGHFSYPRVHNLKVYLLGYLTGLAGIAYFALYSAPLHLDLPPAGPGYLKSLLLLVMANFLVTVFVPSFVKYRIARGVTLSIVVVEVILIFLLRFAPAASGWVSAFHFDDFKSVPFWIGPVWAGAIFGITVWKIRQDFYLGGAIAGCALFYAVVWCTGSPQSHSEIQHLIFTAAPLYLGIGILAHWFLRMDHRIAYDPLLHIYNRDYCSKIITEQANLNVSPPFTVAMVDIDHFKKVNDTYGHQAGDAVLYTVAQAVCRGVVPQGIVCRYGGEELAIFFPQQNTKQVTPVMEKVRESIQKIKTPSGKKQITVTISCGISHRDNFSQSIMDVIHAADKALYRAKKGGRNQVRAGKS